MKQIFLIKSVILIFLLFSFTYCASLGGIKRSKAIQSEAGLNIPEWGVAIDAVYDTRLDYLIPGYKIINVVVTNRGQGPIYLDPNKDKWIIRDNVGKPHTAINHLRFISNDLWNDLPIGLKNELEYPQTVRIGNTTKIDLFFPFDTELNNLREIIWRSFHFKKEFIVHTSIEKNLDWEPKSEPIPKLTPAQKQAVEKYDGIEPQDPASLTKEVSPRFDPVLDDFSIPVD